MSQENRIAIPSWLIVLLVILIGGIFLIGAYIVIRDLNATPADEEVGGGVAFVQDDDFDGIESIDPPRQMPDFTLTGTDGEPLSLYDLPEQPTILFFGFTHCPDICPITLGEARAIYDELGDQGDNVTFVFISVDGNRDTPEALASYFEVRQVDHFAVGMTGDPEEVRRIGADYSVRFVYNEPDQNGNYSIDHTSSMFLLDGNREWIRKYAFGTDSSLISEDLRSVLAES
ncbi:MAG: SCO family protein [Anaerolineae bacterium]|nr:SCO family protein [Anaerolineae bacterium]MCB9459266.1 SCO family protein [Anaerolineaceae bacterium]